MAADIYIPQVVVEAFGETQPEILIPQVVIEVFGNTSAAYSYVATGGVTVAGSYTRPAILRSMDVGVKVSAPFALTYVAPQSRSMSAGVQVGATWPFVAIAPAIRSMDAGVKVQSKTKQLQKTITVKARPSMVSNFPLVVILDDIPSDAIFKKSDGSTLPAKLLSSSRAIIKIDLLTTSQSIGVYYA